MKRKLNDAQVKFLSNLSRKDREILADIIIHAPVEGDYTGMDSDGGSFFQDDIHATLAGLAYKIRNFDSTDIHWD